MAPFVTRSPRCGVVRYERSTRDVGVDIAQRFELVFFALSHLTRYQGKLNTLPGSTSCHSGVAKAPVYLVIAGEALCGGEPSVITQKLSRISRSSRTLVPFRSMQFSTKPQEKIAHDEPESA